MSTENRRSSNLTVAAPEQFYKTQGIANWLAENCGITTVVQRFRDQNMGSLELLGTVGSSKVSFLENGLQFQADILRGQKTGFFLDQRDNRHLIRQLSNARRVLNLFSYNGGFSIAAGTGGAKHVTSVDLARFGYRVCPRNLGGQWLATKMA